MPVKPICPEILGSPADSVPKVLAPHTALFLKSGSLKVVEPSPAPYVVPYIEKRFEYVVLDTVAPSSQISFSPNVEDKVRIGLPIFVCSFLFLRLKLKKVFVIIEADEKYFQFSASLKKGGQKHVCQTERL